MHEHRNKRKKQQKLKVSGFQEADLMLGGIPVAGRRVIVYLYTADREALEGSPGRFTITISRDLGLWWQR